LDSEQVHIAIIASTPALRSGLRALLASDERIEVIAEAGALSDLSEAEADVLLVASDEFSADAASAALADYEAPPAILLMSEDAQAARALAGLPLRAWGLLPPDAGEEELLAAVFAVNEGLLAASPALIQPLLGPALAAEEQAELDEELTEREGEVLQLLAHGYQNKQIALELGISEHTVKFHVSAIYAKLSVTNRTEAVRRGARLGLITL
jgi:DNA-binding NarL/FixJ family response regulator